MSRHTAAAVVVLFLCVPVRQGPAADNSRVLWVAEGTVPADFDGDGRVGFSDFLLFVEGFGARTGQTEFKARLDLDGDGSVDFADFLSFVSAFSGPAPLPRTGYAVYVADVPENSVVVFDFDTHLQIDYLPFRVPSGVQVSDDQGWIYVSEAFGLFEVARLDGIESAIAELVQRCLHQLHGVFPVGKGLPYG